MLPAMTTTPPCTGTELDRPSRVVDRNQRAWMLAAGLDGADAYTADNHTSYLPLERVVAEHGPVRPVLPITVTDRHVLVGLVAGAKRKAVYSVAVAVYRTWNALRDDHGGMTHPTESFEISTRQLRAGRPGSWEAQLLTEMALWVGHGKPSRVDEAAAASIQAMLYRWTTDPDRYTELAETLAAVVSGYADSTEAGWAGIADQWLQRGALDAEGVRLTYSLLYSQSEHFDPAVLS